MNMLSINIRGIRVARKSGWIKSLKENFEVSFFFGMQESMCVNTHMSMLDNFWGGQGFKADWVNSNGQSRGIVNMWDPKVFQKENSIISDNFLVTTGFLVDGKIKLNVVNVYAPQLNSEKKRGDFNSVRCREERKNTNFDAACAKDFNDFINEAGLKEFNMKDKLPNACLRALPRNLSDHSPLVLSLIDTNFGPKPFRWFNSWLDKEGCDDLVAKVLEDCVFSGPSDMVLLKKLKKWIKDTKVKEGEELAKLKAEREEYELLMEEREPEEDEVWVCVECRKGIEEVELLKSKDIKQKSRVKWANFGDDNTAYFHSVVNGRKARNSIPGLEVEGEEHFREKISLRLCLECEGIKSIIDMVKDGLVASFSREEIKAAVFECGSNKAPGPDGFNFLFVKRFWKFLEDDFFNILTTFHDSGFISHGCGSSFITLIPKVKNPLGVKDYRPITLIGIISTVVSKILANWLKKILGLVISETQSAFLQDQFILDGPFIVNELMDWLKNHHKKAFLFKIDFEKAYDNVNWNFLISILLQM
ncbi:uncharacterized protein LOC143614650 [Bidens hawaiensis]|uniref:uncharacterized protein LOC143614650 n=1 Tax=Bidens hawaiensis TaxID=980011 RepID=UPI0040494E34